MKRDAFGVWEVTVPSVDGNVAIAHDTRVKISMIDPHGSRIERVPAWISRAVQDAGTRLFEGHFWNPGEPYSFAHPAPARPESLKIYECHVGICTPKEGISTFRDFTASILPRVARIGYNCIQLMAIMEHAYYASFGYQVTNFFAPSSRFGTPDDLKQLVDTAHGLGLLVLLDVVHSHASSNVLDGINEFDGTRGHFFHEGPRGQHELWKSRLFNYGHREVQRFLLSNLRWWHEQFGFDGFRFDGVTSMLYKHHGIAYGFTGDYREYYHNDTVDGEAMCYIQLANTLCARLGLVSIAEDVSGMPLTCRPTLSEAGLGFTHRLAMSIPDMWIKEMKAAHHGTPDECLFSPGRLAHALTNRRHDEATVAYAESHDQALVGDKTIAFWLMDAAMYTHMSDLTEMTGVIDRGLALHKMIRLVTFGLGGEAYLCFMGNEFGHPEWLDFPRAGNRDSFAYARRQYGLADDRLLRYRYLERFEQDMLHMRFALCSPQAWVSLKHELDKVLVFERDGLLWVFNWHPCQSLAGYRVGVQTPGTYAPVLCSDSTHYGGWGRIDQAVRHTTEPVSYCQRAHSLLLYLPSRTAFVLRRVD